MGPKVKTGYIELEETEEEQEEAIEIIESFNDAELYMSVSDNWDFDFDTVE